MAPMPSYRAGSPPTTASCTSRATSPCRVSSWCPHCAGDRPRAGSVDDAEDLEMTLIHDTFTLDRTYDAAVPEVWRAWTDPELRARWFHAPEGWKLLERKHDLRVGGNEILHG